MAPSQIIGSNSGVNKKPDISAKSDNTWWREQQSDLYARTKRHLNKVFFSELPRNHPDAKRRRESERTKKLQIESDFELAKKLETQLKSEEKKRIEIAKQMEIEKKIKADAEAKKKREIEEKAIDALAREERMANTVRESMLAGIREVTNNCQQQSCQTHFLSGPPPIVAGPTVIPVTTATAAAVIPQQVYQKAPGPQALITGTTVGIPQFVGVPIQTTTSMIPQYHHIQVNATGVPVTTQQLINQTPTAVVGLGPNTNSTMISTTNLNHGSTMLQLPSNIVTTSGPTYGAVPGPPVTTTTTSQQQEQFIVAKGQILSNVNQPKQYHQTVVGNGVHGGYMPMASSSSTAQPIQQMVM